MQTSHNFMMVIFVVPLGQGAHSHKKSDVILIPKKFGVFSMKVQHNLLIETLFDVVMQAITPPMILFSDSKKSTKSKFFKPNDSR